MVPYGTLRHTQQGYVAHTMGHDRALRGPSSLNRIAFGVERRPRAIRGSRRCPADGGVPPHPNVAPLIAERDGPRGRRSDTVPCRIRQRQEALRVEKESDEPDARVGIGDHVGVRPTAGEHDVGMVVLPRGAGVRAHAM